MDDETSESVTFGDLENVACLKELLPSTLGHELRNPLAAIRALSEIVRDNPDMQAKRREQLLNSIVDEAERLAQCIDKLLHDE